MYKYLNLHPKDLLIDDCVKRSIAMAANMEYAMVQRELNRHKRITVAAVYNEDDNPESYVKNILLGDKIIFSKTKHMTGARFCEEYPCGNYILDMDTHWTARTKEWNTPYKIIPRAK